MDKAAEYRELAVQCVLMASAASSQSQKAALLQMAERWSDLADQITNAELAIRGKSRPAEEPEAKP